VKEITAIRGEAVAGRSASVRKRIDLLKESMASNPAIIVLTKEKVALVDAKDYQSLVQFKWYAKLHGTKWYARKRRPDKRGAYDYMHRFLLNAPQGKLVDHKNGDGLDNQRNNIRLCTSSQNNANRRKKPGSSSQYKGVTLRTSGRWQAHIVIERKAEFLGNYIVEEDAARSYDKRAVEAFGEFALPNFPSESRQPCEG
jgi:HNH endonuclease